MAMAFEELDDSTRYYMREAFEAEQRDGPYCPAALSPTGLALFPELMREALARGDEVDLARALGDPVFWNVRDRAGRRVNVQHAAARLALCEFNTWYVRGLAMRLLAEGETHCEVCRGADPKWAPADCKEHEGQVVPLQLVLDGHRRRYWPEPGDDTAFSVPFTPGCHHTIRRVTASAATPGPTA